MLSLLIAHGADVAATERPPSRATPLHSAARAGSLECCQLLVKAGANPYARNDAGESPMEIAEEAEREDIVAVFKTVPKPVEERAVLKGFFGCCD